MATFSFDTKCHNLLTERFKGIFEEQLINEICNSGELRKVAENTELLSISETITHMPLIVSGSVKVMAEDNDGDELFLYYLKLGDTCAMTLNCCSRSSRSVVSAITEEDSEILFVPVEYMDKWMMKYRTWREFVLESFNSRLNEMLQAIESLAFDNMEERLLKYLQNRYALKGDGHLTLTHLHIANDLHSSRVVISRLMKKLEIQGIIKQFRNRVELLKF